MHSRQSRHGCAKDSEAFRLTFHADRGVGNEWIPLDYLKRRLSSEAASKTSFYEIWMMEPEGVVFFIADVTISTRCQSGLLFYYHLIIT
jgi:hypothetical protein